MGYRLYNRKLKCGCLISSDKGGGCVPCCYPGYGATEEEEKRCEEAWAEWMKTDDYKKYLKEVAEKNDCDIDD